MSNTIHFPEKSKQQLVRGFNRASETDGLFSHDLDMEFSGVRTVHVTTLKTYPLQNYNRNTKVGTGSRYGDTQEVGDSVQTFEMTQDKSLSLSVDKGNNIEQFNMKKAGEIMRAEREEHIVPEVDRYRLGAWAKNAGIHYELTEETTEDTIIRQIVKLHTYMKNKGVKGAVSLLISLDYLDTLRLAKQWVNLDSLGGKSLPSGAIGQFDGMPVKGMSSDIFPAIPFMLLHKGSVIAPMKIKDFKGHVDPPGLSGDLLEFRMIHDAFVLGKKANGVAVACPTGTVAKVPTIAVEGGKATITAEGATAIYYTLDGSDPRYAKDAKVYTAAVDVAAGDEVKAFAKQEGKWNSAVAEATVGTNT